MLGTQPEADADLVDSVVELLVGGQHLGQIQSPVDLVVFLGERPPVELRGRLEIALLLIDGSEHGQFMWPRPRPSWRNRSLVQGKNGRGLELFIAKLRVRSTQFAYDLVHGIAPLIHR